MKIKNLLNQAKKLKEEMRAETANIYHFDRDAELNLHIDFPEKKYTLPVLKFRPYQQEIQEKLFRDGIKRFFLVRPRRAGKEVESWNILIQAAVETPGLYFMIYPQNVGARRILWDGAITMPDKSSLKFLDMIPTDLILGKPKKDEMKIELQNGSIIQILGADSDVEKLRGTNPRGAVFSEYAFSDPRVYQTLMPVFRQNDGWVIIQTTFNGMNHAYNYYNEIKNNPEWFCRCDSVETLVDENGNRYVTDEMIEEDRKSGMPEFMILQEYYSVVQLNEQSVYFALEIKNLQDTNRIIDGLLLHNRPVYLAMDLGMNDLTACTLFQLDEQGNVIIINYFEDNNQKFEFYIQKATNFCAKNNLLLKKIILPHDGKNREKQSGKDFIDFSRDLGYHAVAVSKPKNKIIAIQQMRQQLYKIKFNKENSSRLMECLSNYSKEWDVKNGRYKDEPKHDWASHGVDSFQTLTLGMIENVIDPPRTQVIYNPPLM